jgi:hypothetical protein
MMVQTRVLGSLLLPAVLLTGCAGQPGSLKAVLGVPDSSGASSSGGRWVLIQNPRYGATMGEPEYVWVEEDRIPSTLTTMVFGKQHVLATPDLLRRYGPPPEGGLVSPLQGGPPLASRGGVPAGAVPAPASPASPPAAAAAPPPAPALVARTAPAPELRPHGYVVHIQARLIVVDLTAADGVQPGERLSVRRAHVSLKHPVTGEPLGELDEEIGTARVVEVRERFSVAELEEIRPGFEARVKDRVRLKAP